MLVFSGGGGTAKGSSIALNDSSNSLLKGMSGGGLANSNSNF